MNYFEFKQQLLKDSYTKDEEFHRLRKEDLRCAKAYEEAMEFEKTLKNALQIKAPDNLKDSIILRQTTNQKETLSFKNYAMAASLLFSFIFASFFWYNSQPNTVEEYISRAFIDESNVPLSAKPIELAKIKSVFADFKTGVNGDLGKVVFIHNCHTPNGTGVHMVVSTNQGLVTVYYMPRTNLDQKRVEFDIDRSKASLVAMEKGSIAIIADTEQQLASIEPVLQNNLYFL